MDETKSDPMEPEIAGWTWLLADAAGVTTAGPLLSFASQDAAEEWLRDHFDELSDDGVDMVSLSNGEQVVYGPMSLAPEAADGADAAIF